MTVTDLTIAQKAISKTADDKSHRLLAQSLMLLGLVSLMFAAMPSIDLSVSRLFWEPVAGFYLNENGFLTAFRDINRYLPWIVSGAAVALLLLTPRVWHLKYSPQPHKLLFVVTFFAAGPGLGVHLIKMLIGRARPRVLEEFGGAAVFTPPWQLTDQCVRNCSFISGEAASAFALLTLVLFVRPKYATLYLGAVGIVAAGFSFNRVMLGAHFLSDVVIAWTVMFVLAVLLWQWFSRIAPQIDALFIREPDRPPT